MDIATLTDYFQNTNNEKKKYFLLTRLIHTIDNIDNKLDMYIQPHTSNMMFNPSNGIEQSNTYIDNLVNRHSYINNQDPQIIHKIKDYFKHKYSQHLFDQQHNIIADIAHLYDDDIKHDYSTIWHSIENTNENMEETCPICYDKFGKESLFGHDQHVFHKKCIDQWYTDNGTCPICRRHFGKSRTQRKRKSRKRKSRTQRKRKSRTQRKRKSIKRIT
jgi:hypothetical protein